MDALRNGQIEDSEALAIADFAPGNENVQRKGLAILMEGGSKTEARERMVAELELARMAKELGIEQGEDLFGNTMDNDAWLDFVAKYVVRRRNEIAKDIQYLRTTATRKNAKAMAEKYGVDVKDPDGMKKALKEAESLRDRWKNPYTDSELMNEVKDAYRADHPGEDAASQSERVWADYSRQVGEMREGVTHFSTSGEREERKYRVVDDSAGLQQHLDKKVEYVDITYAGDLAKDKEAYEKKFGRSLSDVAYYREAIIDTLMEIAERNPDPLPIGETGYYLVLPRSRSKAKKAQGRARTPKKMQAVQGLEDVVKKAIHLDSEAPQEKEGESKKKKSLSAVSNTFEKFGFPVRLNGEEMFFWFNGTTLEKDAHSVEFYEFGITDVQKKEAERSSARESSSPTEPLSASEVILGDVLSRVKNKNVVNVEKVSNDVQKQVPTTHFSVIGERAATWDKYKDRAFKGRDDGMMRAELDASQAKLNPGYAEKVKSMNRGEFVGYLGSVLDFPELFEAYPWLKEKEVVASGREGSAAMLTREIEKPLPMKGRIYLGVNKDGNVLGSLLHEIQHIVQAYEGFAAGITGDDAVRNVWRELGREDELKVRPILSPSLYKSTAGEIEARNVTWRMFMTDENRRDKAFNDTLDIGAEHALRYSTNEYFAAMDAKQAAEQAQGRTHFSVAGMRARTAGANMEASYVDPADGKRKFVIPVNGARLSTGFTPGQLNAPLGGHKDVSLAALLHYPELYQAYPWLADVRVRIYNPTEKQAERMGVANAGGFFCPAMDGEAGYIAVNSRYVQGDGGRLLNVLLHESQHAVQSYEGHARGAGFGSVEDALEYIDMAIAQREKSGVEDDWAMANLAFLQVLRRKLVESEGEASEFARYYAYQHSRGEQEARYAGEQKEGAPMAADGSGLTSKGEGDYATIAVNSEAKELGGVTFGGLSRFDYLLESRLAPGGEFNYDRTVYQMRDAIMRRAGELEVLGREHDGAKLMAEAMAVMESVEGLLPNEYRYGLEAYKVYLSSYAKLYESGDAMAAGSMILMEGWDKRMEGAYHNIAVRMLMGRMRKDEMEFWAHRKDTLEKLEGEQGNFQELVKEKAEKLRAQGFSQLLHLRS